MKPRIQPYISEENYDRLLALAKRPGCSISSVIDQAISAYCAGDSDDERDAALSRRLDRQTRQFGRLERGYLVLEATLATFVRYFMTITPQVPENQLDAARAKGDLRFDLFVRHVREDVQSERRILMNAIEDITADKTDYFTRDELDRLHEPAPEQLSKEALDA